MILTVVIILIAWVYMAFMSIYISGKYDRKTKQEYKNTLETIRSSFDAYIKNGDELSKMLVSDTDIQEQMKTGRITSDSEAETLIVKKINSLMQFFDGVESVSIIDLSGNILVVGARRDSATNAELIKRLGVSNSDGSCRLVFDEYFKNSLALVRSYNSLVDFRSLGTIAIDFRFSIFSELTKKIASQKANQFVFTTDRNIIVYSSAGEISDDRIQELIKEVPDDKEKVMTVSASGRNWYMTAATDEGCGWKIIRFDRVSPGESTVEIISESLPYLILMIAVTAGAVGGVSILLTSPLQYLLSCMKGNNSQSLLPAEKKPAIYEIRLLFDQYNSMVARIDALMQETVDKQARIRQVEFNEIQQQLKPHFLYNTLDTIQALAMMGDTEKVCRLIEELGDFYRKSVSGGKEFLTIAEECRLVDDYISIMQIRFENSFDFSLHKDRQCDAYLLPKLTMQPLIENAFQHGIRNRGSFGRIELTIKKEDDTLIISIADSGDGIPQSIVDELQHMEDIERGKSLGLRGNLARLHLIYGDSFSFSIENNGTSCISLRIRTSALRTRDEEAM
jgi:two-component system sensor histidine kinase YesM